MNIKKLNSTSGIQFKDIEQGDVFIISGLNDWLDNAIYMKTNESPIAMDGIRKSNCVCLDDGQLSYLSGTTPILVYGREITIDMSEFEPNMGDDAE